MCGFLASEENYNPLIAALPKILKIDIRYAASREWIEPPSALLRVNSPKDD